MRWTRGFGGAAVRMQAWVRTLRTIIGVPDYDRYRRHMEANHPGCAILSPAEFAKERLEARYSKPGSRCC